MSTYTISPSAFAYLYEDCKLCYWLKIKYKISHPSMPMPGVFSAMNTRIQGSLIGKNLKDISPGLPDCIIESQEKQVYSKPVVDTGVSVKGKYDLLAKTPDGKYIIIDLKISKPGEDKIEKYKTQLCAYKYAFENPLSGEPIEISRLGLLILYPDSVNFADSTMSLTFPPSWHEVPCDMFAFTKLIKDIEILLNGEAPEESENCAWCKYRHIGEQLSHTDASEEDIDF